MRKPLELEKIRPEDIQSVDYWRSIMNSLDDGIVIIDRDFKIHFANEAANKLCAKYLPEDSGLSGQYCHKAFHGLSEPCTASGHWSCAALMTWETGRPSKEFHVREGFPGVQKEDRYIETSAFPLHNGAGNNNEVVLIIRDITESKRMERRIINANFNLLSLNAIAHAVSQSLELDTMLNSVLDKVLELIKGDTGGILLLDEETQRLYYRVHRGLSENFIESVNGLKIGEGVAGLAAQQRQAIYVDDISNDERFSKWQIINEGLRAFASIPLISKDRLVGVMNVTSHTLQTFEPEDVQLLTSISNQIAVGIENSLLYCKLQKRQEKRGELLHLFIEMQEDERRRIARGLHDEISQSLTSLMLNIETIANQLSPDKGDVKEKLKALTPMAGNTLEEIHNIIYQLRPTLLDDLGLIPALEWYTDNYLEGAGIKACLETVGSERRLPLDLEVAIYRIVQEASTNIIRHAKADSASLVIEFTDTCVSVIIEDDGIGFDPSIFLRNGNSGLGLGLLNIKERVEHLGGKINIVSAPGNGTCINFNVPIHSEVGIGN